MLPSGLSLEARYYHWLLPIEGGSCRVCAERMSVVSQTDGKGAHTSLDMVRR